MDLLYLPVFHVKPMTSSPYITSSPCHPLGLFTVSLSSPPLTRPLTPSLRASCHLLTYASSQKGVVALAVVLALQRMLHRSHISPRGLQGQAFLGVCRAWELKYPAPNSGISAHPTDIFRLTSVTMYYEGARAEAYTGSPWLVQLYLVPKAAALNSSPHLPLPLNSLSSKPA